MGCSNESRFDPSIPVRFEVVRTVISTGCSGFDSEDLLDVPDFVFVIGNVHRRIRGGKHSVQA